MKQSVIEIFRYDVTTIWLPVLLLLTQSPSRLLVLVSQTETQFDEEINVACQIVQFKS